MLLNEEAAEDQEMQIFERIESLGRENGSSQHGTQPASGLDGSISASPAGPE